MAVSGIALSGTAGLTSPCKKGENGMKKAVICMLTVLLVLGMTGCQTKQPGVGGDRSEPLFTAEDLPKLDGSTANIPMAVLMVQRLLDIPEDEAEPMIDFSTTPYAYMALAHGSADLLLVYEADENTKLILADMGAELEYHPIGRDALVFITNEGNPVTSLTVAQLQDIYQGKITNWQALGGENKTIEAYQRPVMSGSQALMVKLVMGDLPLMEAPTERYPHEMSGLINLLANYNNEKNALGYSVYYYVQNMYNLPGLRLMAVDGVAPSEQTIADGSYPFINEFYAVIRKNEPKDSKTRQLLNWILSDEGKQAIRDAGYVGL